MGYAAVTDGNYIYYISNELGETGIYSMNLRGGDVQLECTNPSITSLQCKDGDLYFSGLEQIVDNRSTVEWTDHVYTAWHIQKNHKEARKASFVVTDENIRGFYIISDAYAAINYGPQWNYLIFHDCSDVATRFTHSSTAPLTDKGTIHFNGQVTEQEPIQDGRKAEIKLNIFEIDGAYLITEDEKDDLFGISSFIIDSQTGKVVLSPDNEAQYLENFQVLLMDEVYLYCFYKDPHFSQTGQMVIVNRENWEVEQMFPLGDIAETYRVSYAMKRDGKIYMLAEQWSSDDKAVLPLKNQKLLVMDPETFEWEVVRDMKEGERIVGLDERGVVYLADGGIWKAKWEGEALGGETRLCDAPKDIDKEKYTIDYAGDWMFVYKIYGDFTTGIREIDPGQQLVYKINLKTGEVVENIVPLDFSQVDPYRRDSKTK